MQKVDREPVFKWWVENVLQKRDIIVAKVWQRGAKKYAKTTMNFGIKCPKTVDQALVLENKNGNTLWSDAIAKDTKNAQIAFF